MRRQIFLNKIWTHGWLLLVGICSRWLGKQQCFRKSSSPPVWDQNKTFKSNQWKTSQSFRSHLSVPTSSWGAPPHFSPHLWWRRSRKCSFAILPPMSFSPKEPRSLLHSTMAKLRRSVNQRGFDTRSLSPPSLDRWGSFWLNPFFTLTKQHISGNPIEVEIPPFEPGLMWNWCLWLRRWQFF